MTWVAKGPSAFFWSIYESSQAHFCSANSERMIFWSIGIMLTSWMKMEEWIPCVSFECYNKSINIYIYQICIWINWNTGVQMQFDQIAPKCQQRVNDISRWMSISNDNCSFLSNSVNCFQILIIRSRLSISKIIVNTIKNASINPV